MVEVEEERGGAGRLQQRHRIAPVIASRLPQRKAVEGAEARHIGRGNQRAADDIFLVPRELRPEGGFEIGVLAHRNRARIGKRGGAGGHRVVEARQVGLAHQHGQVVVAEAHRPVAQRIARGEHVGTLGSGFLIHRTRTPEREVDALLGGGAFVGRIAFGDDHLEGQTQQVVEQAGRGRLGVILEPEDRSKIGRRRPAQLHRIEAEGGAAVREHMADVGVVRRPPHGAHLAVVERREQLEHFRIGPAVGAVGDRIIPQHRRAVILQAGDKAGDRRLERADVLGISLKLVLPGTGEHLRQALGQPGLAARGATDEGDELVVDEQRSARQPLLPARVDVARQGIGELGFELHLHPAADDVVIHHEARIERRAQHHLASRGMGVERVRILGLEQQAGHLNRAHHRSIAQQHGVLVDKARIGQAVADLRFLRAPRGGADPFTGHRSCTPNA